MAELAVPHCNTMARNKAIAVENTFGPNGCELSEHGGVYNAVPSIDAYSQRDYAREVAGSYQWSLYWWSGRQRGGCDI